MTKGDFKTLCPVHGVTCVQQHLDVAGILLLSLDAEGKIRALNRSGHEDLGYSDGELLGRDWFETCLPASDRAAAREAFRRLMAGDLPSWGSPEETILTRSGSERIIHWHHSVLTDERGKRVGVVCSGKDVTDRKRAEAMRGESEERLRTVFEASPDAIAMVDLNGRLLVANKKAAELFGFPSVDELLSGATDCLDLTAPEDRARVREEMARALESGGIANTECVFVRRDGTRFPVELNGAVQRDGQGNPQSLIVVFRDVADRRRAEEAIRQERAFSDAAIRSVPGVFYVLDSQGTYVRWNQTLQEMTGLPPEQIRRTSAMSFIHEDDRARVAQAVAEVFQNGYAETETRVVWDGKTVRDYVVTGQRMEIGGALYLVGSGVDVTERKKAEESLRESEAKFRTLFESASDGIMLCDEHAFLDCNPRTLELFGVTCKGRFLGRHPRAVSPPRQPDGRESALAAEEHIRTALEKGWDRFEWVHRRSDGSDFPAEVSLSAFECRKKRYLQATVRDMTAHKKAEAALRESEERFRTIIETSPDAIAMIDLEGRFLMANQRAALMGGFGSVEELLSCEITAFDLLVPEDWSRARDNIREILAAGVLPNQKYAVVRMDGSRVPVEVSASVMCDSDGNPKALIMVVRDITERERVEAALRQSESLYRSIVDNINIGISLVDCEQTIVAMNPAQARMFSKTPGDFLGKKCFREFEKRDSICPHCPGVKAIATGHSAEAETEGVCDDGTRFAVRIKAFPMFGPDGAPTGFIELVEDVTHHKRAERLAQEAREAAEAANRAKSEFLANMSHEIRTPLTAILGYAELLLNEPEPGRVLDAAETIKRNGEHLLAIITDILDISRIEAGRLQPEYCRCSPRQLVNEVASLMRVRADGKGLGLAVECQGAVPETIQTDPVRLRQILINLVGNAVKFTDVGGVRLVLRMDRTDAPEPELRIDVIDTGIGLTENQLANLFRPFSQVDGSMQRRFGGSGLGLAISKRLAELLGGSIAVRSESGKGSAFSVTLPGGPLDQSSTVARRAPSPPSPPQAARDEVRLAGRLLLAEDGLDNQRLLCCVLRKAGAEVTVAENGQLAVQQALAAQREGKPFGLILMDMQMPVMNGYEATACLRQEGFSAPIIALTAHAMTEDRQKCLDAGCDDYMSKPVAPRDLVNLVAAHLARANRTAADAAQAPHDDP